MDHQLDEANGRAEDASRVATALKMEAARVEQRLFDAEDRVKAERRQKELKEAELRQVRHTRMFLPPLTWVHCTPCHHSMVMFIY